MHSSLEKADLGPPSSHTGGGRTCLVDQVADYLDCHLVLRVLHEALTSLLGGLPGALQSGDNVTNNAKIMSKTKSQRRHQQCKNYVKNKVAKKGTNKVTKKGDNTRNYHLQSDSTNATGTSRHRPGAAWPAEPTRGLTACSSISALTRIYVDTIKDLVETDVACLED